MVKKVCNQYRDAHLYWLQSALRGRCLPLLGWKHNESRRRRRDVESAAAANEELKSGGAKSSPLSEIGVIFHARQSWGRAFRRHTEQQQQKDSTVRARTHIHRDHEAPPHRDRGLVINGSRGKTRLPRHAGPDPAAASEPTTACCAHASSQSTTPGFTHTTGGCMQGGPYVKALPRDTRSLNRTQHAGSTHLRRVEETRPYPPREGNACTLKFSTRRRGPGRRAKETGIGIRGCTTQSSAAKCV
ncbi:hypothetical protein MRX96_028161 [Rhipicephalus microplus]